MTLVPLKGGFSCYYRLLGGQALCFWKAPRGNPDYSCYINMLKCNWIAMNCSVNVTSVCCYFVFISHKSDICKTAGGVRWVRLWTMIVVRESRMLLKEGVDESDWDLYILFWVEIWWEVSALQPRRWWGFLHIDTYMSYRYIKSGWSDR